MGIRIDERKVRVFMAMQGIDSVRELAHRASIHEDTIWKAFKGRGFRSETLDKLAMALNCNPLDLVAMEGYPDPLVEAPAFTAC